MMDQSKPLLHLILLKNLAAAAQDFSSDIDHKIYVTKSRPSQTLNKETSWVCVILDQPCKVNRFKFKMDVNMQFVAWRCGKLCQFCGAKHSLLKCDKFAPLILSGQMAGQTHLPTMLRKPPDVIET